ncbi:hypothetical protein [Halomonas sp. E14]|uniref:hypothetical protein n=1 Tax=Halomonas sp. E14 TaxID=3397245 RepID=UPI00403E6806
MKTGVVAAIFAGVMATTAYAEPLFEVNERLADIEARQQAERHAAQSTTRQSEAIAEERQRAADRARTERERLNAEHERRQQEVRQSREQAVSAWENAPRLNDRQAQFINDVFGGVYSQSDEYVAGIGRVSQSMLRVGVEGGRLHMAFANRSLNPVVESIDEENRSFNFRIGGGRLATMQRSPNMAVLTGYNGTQYLYFVRSLAGEDRERLGMPRQGVAAGSGGQPPAAQGARSGSAILTGDQVQQITAMMLDAYRDGRAEEMYRTEMQCWVDVPAGGGQRDVTMEACAVANFAATVIEVANADEQGRRPHAEYDADEAMSRVLSQWSAHGMEESALSERLMQSVDANMSTIVAALEASGL